MRFGIYTLDDFDVKGKTVLCRVDMNQPVDRASDSLKSIQRITACAPTLKELSDKGARVVVMAHQGSDIEYKNFYNTRPHARVLSELLGCEVKWIEDVCGPTARDAIRNMKDGEIILLDNVRFCSEEQTLFELNLKLTHEQQAHTQVVEKLAPLGDLYVCDAFAAAHRDQPTLCGFEQVLPSAMGRLFEREYCVVSELMEKPEHPCTFVLGGSKISDAFMMMETVLASGAADKVLPGGLVGQILLASQGKEIGSGTRGFIEKSGYGEFIEKAKGIYEKYADRIVLPIDLAKARTIAVVGENAIKMMTVGGGSSSLKVQHEYTPLEGIRAAADGKAEVIYERGYVGDVTGDYNGVKTGQDLSESRSEAQLIADAVAAARKADAVIFVGGLNKSNHQDCEGDDRLQYGLPYAQDKVIGALAGANPNLAVVIVSGNAVAMPWIGRVPAVLEAWFSGSEAGNALADVVFGAVNPSGKLPFTFPVRLEDNSAHALGEYPGTDKVTYNEGIFVGYRWHDKEQLKPLFAFGHGLSYTTFDIANVQADRTTLAANGRIRVSADVTNTGSRPGAEVVQLYIGDEESSLPRPVKELKGFQKIALDPGQTQTVTFEITPDMLQYYDDARGAWVAEPGAFTAYVGAASDDIRGTAAFELK